MKRVQVFIAMTFTLAVVLAGCSQGDDDSGGVDSISGESNDGSSGESGELSDKDRNDLDKKWNECMVKGLQENGLDPALLNPPEGEDADDPAEDLSDAEEKAFEDVNKECEKYRPTANLSEGEKAEQMEAGIKHAKCMRDKGFENFPDPKENEQGGGGITLELNEDSGIDPEDPAFQKADKECMDKYMPDAENDSGGEE